MLKLKNGVDILSHVGGIKSIDEARKLFQEKLDNTHLARRTGTPFGGFAGYLSPCHLCGPSLVGQH